MEDEEILERFEDNEFDRAFLTPPEIAKALPVSGAAVRKRLKKMDGEKVETVEVAGQTLWKTQGKRVFADGDVKGDELRDAAVALSTILIVSVFGSVLLAALDVVSWMIAFGIYLSIQLLLATLFMAADVFDIQITPWFQLQHLRQMVQERLVSR